MLVLRCRKKYIQFINRLRITSTKTMALKFVPDHVDINDSYSLLRFYAQLHRPNVVTSDSVIFAISEVLFKARAQYPGAFVLVPMFTTSTSLAVAGTVDVYARAAENNSIDVYVVPKGQRVRKDARIVPAEGVWVFRRLSVRSSKYASVPSRCTDSSLEGKEWQLAPSILSKALKTVPDPSINISGTQYDVKPIVAPLTVVDIVRPGATANTKDDELVIRAMRVPKHAVRQFVSRC
jgi:hypothetical protein